MVNKNGGAAIPIRVVTEFGDESPADRFELLIFCVERIFDDSTR